MSSLDRVAVFLADRLDESSTIRGLVGFIAALTGLTFNGATVEVVIAICYLLDCVLKAVMPDKLSRN